MDANGALGIGPPGPNGRLDSESVRSPSPRKRAPARTPLRRDAAHSVRFADDTHPPSSAVTNADHSARKKSARRIVTRVVTGGSSEDEDEEDELARRIFADSDSDEDGEDGLLPEENEASNKKGKPRGRKKKPKEPELPPETEGFESYFQQNRKARQITSNSTLSSLPSLDHGRYFQLIREHVPDHVEDRRYLEDLHKSSFAQWQFELSQGFNVLLYGYGSKRRLLMEFAKQVYTTPSSLVVVNGYVPTLTAKDIFSTVAEALLGRGHTVRLGSNPSEMLDNVIALLDSEEITGLTLMIHNLDGESIRTERAQVLIARLCAHPKISLVATIDHLRAPLLWDAARASQFNFLWHDATTFAPYAVESSIDESLALIGGSGRAGGTKGVKFVLASLPMNAKSLFRVLISHQLEAMMDDPASGQGAGTNEEWGVEYKVLYQKAVEEFICSNDMAFRTLLKEYVILVPSAIYAFYKQLLIFPTDFTTIKWLRRRRILKEQRCCGHRLRRRNWRLYWKTSLLESLLLLFDTRGSCFLSSFKTPFFCFFLEVPRHSKEGVFSCTHNSVS